MGKAIRIRAGCGGCRGAKTFPQAGRSDAARLYDRRRRLCDACSNRSDCYVAHQTPCSQRRILSDPKRFCPAQPPRW